MTDKPAPSETKEPTAPPKRVPFGAPIAALIVASKRPATVGFSEKPPAPPAPPPEPEAPKAEAKAEEVAPPASERKAPKSVLVVLNELESSEPEKQPEVTEPEKQPDMTATGSIPVDVSVLGKIPTTIQPSAGPPGVPVPALPVPPGEVDRLILVLDPSRTSIGKPVTITVMAVRKDGSKHDVTASCQLTHGPSSAGDLVGNVFTPKEKATVDIGALYGDSTCQKTGLATLTVIVTGGVPKVPSSAMTIVPTSTPPAASVAAPASINGAPIPSRDDLITMAANEAKAKAEAKEKAEERRLKRERAEAKAEADARAEAEAKAKAAAEAKALADKFAEERQKLDEQTAMQIAAEKEGRKKASDRSRWMKLCILAATIAVVWIYLALNSSNTTRVVLEAPAILETAIEEAADVMSMPVTVPMVTPTLPPPPLPAGPVPLSGAEETDTVSGTHCTLVSAADGASRWRCVTVP